MNKLFTNYVKLFTFLSLLTFYLGAAAQTPTYSTGSGAETNTIPFSGAATTGYKYQSLYVPGEFGAVPVRRYITKIYIRATAATSATYTNFEVNLGQTTSMSLSPTTFQGGLTNAFTSPSYQFGASTAGGWAVVNLTTPFLYDPTLSLIVETRHTALTGTGFTAYVKTVPGNRRSYATSGTAVAPSSTFSGVRYDFGFDLAPTVPTGQDNASLVELMEPKNFAAGNYDVKVRVANTGKNVINYLAVQWTLDNVPQTPLYWYNPIDTIGTTGGKSDTILTLGNVLFGAAGRSIKAWTEMPNYVPDGARGDDTINVVCKAALSGVYTIGGASPDFATFNAAVATLKKYGVSGPVTFNVAPGIYTEQVQIDVIEGASATNTITFNGGSASTTTLKYGALYTDAKYTLLLYNTAYITIKNMTIQSTGTVGGWPIQMLSSATTSVKNIAVSKCIIDITGTTGIASASSIFTGIVINGNLATPTTGGRADSITIDSNVFNYGYYGIIAVGLTGNLSLDNRFANNTFNYPAYNGLWLTFQNGSVVDYNTIKGRPGAGMTYGIYFANNASTAPRFSSVQGNLISNAASYGATLTASTNSTSNPGLFINNMIAGNFTAVAAAGLVVGTGSAWNIYHNSINNNAAGNAPTSAAVTVSTGTGLDVRSNIFAVTNPESQGLIISATNSTSFINLNNNIYYKPDTSSGIMTISSTVMYPFDFKGNLGLNAASVLADPGFANDTFLTLNSGCFNGINLGVTRDALGMTRSTAPDIGCFEIQSALNDITIDAVTAPAFPMALGPNDVVVRLKNIGNNNITSADVSYTYNNTTVTLPWTGLLNPCDTASFRFSYPNQIDVTATIKPLKVFTSNPNYTSDGNRLNDTVMVKIGTPLIGNYTIGGSLPDFSTISDAVDALHAVGISGDVYFNIRTGIYNENTLINKIQGAGPGSHVTFQSQAGYADSVVIRHNALVASDNYVMKLSNTSFIKFNALTFTAQNSTNGRAIDMGGIASFDTIINCKINAPSTTTNANALAGIFATNLTGRQSVIKSNVITGGAYNILLAGFSVTSKVIVGQGNGTTTVPTRDMQIEGNTLMNAAYVGASISYQVNVKIKNNTFTSPAATYTTHYGVDISNCDSATEVTGNKINTTGLTATTLAGLRITACEAAASMPGIVANNSVVAGTSGTTTYGLYLTTSKNFNYYNNSINSVGSGTTNYGTYINFVVTTSANNTFRNNIYANKGTTGYALFVQDPTYVNSDYNLLYSTGSGGLVYKNLATATPYATLAAYRAAFPLQEVNSIQYRTPFTSNTNLSINITDTACWAINGRAIHTTNNLDINGNARSTAIINGAADIGAYEFTPTAAGLLTTAVPVTPVAGGIQSFLLFGDTVAKISWNQFYTAPLTIGLRFYSGEYAPNTNSSHYRTNCYWDVQETGIGSYSYAIDLYYKETMKGSIVSEPDMRLAKMHNTNPWNWYSGTQSSVDPVRNILSAPNLYDFSVFTGTDDLNPLPVVLSKFNAVASGLDVNVSWSTASERNASHFILEASVDGRTFTTIGKIASAGNSSVVRTYGFAHIDAQGAMNGSPVIYYRLTSVDKDGSSSYSRIALVNFEIKNVITATAYPNPFTANIAVSITSPVEGIANIEVIDVHGKLISNPTSKNISEGTNDLQLDELSTLEPGVYLVKIYFNGETRNLKVVKQ